MSRDTECDDLIAKRALAELPDPARLGYSLPFVVRDDGRITMVTKGDILLTRYPLQQVITSQGFSIRIVLP